MSLLLDALKKAEEAKRQSAEAKPGEVADTPEPATAPTELSFDPAHTPPGAQLPDLSAHLDTVNADLAAMPTSEPPRRATPPLEPSRPTARQADASEREAIRNVFAAKQTPPPSRKPLWIGLAVAGIGAIGVGGWLWWQLQSVGSSSLSARPSAATTPGPVSGNAGMTPAPVMPAAPPPQVAPAPIAAPAAPPEPPPTPVMPPREEVARAPATEPEGPIKLTRGQLRVNPTLAQAYDALEADNIEAAGKAYEQVLRADPHNTDALNGMAVVALRAGQPARAEVYFIKALEADPKDVTAQSGLINLRGQSDPAATESRLKGMLAKQPDAAGLNASLGNLYAGQARWAEAQQAYFKAYVADTSNPDYVYNLATALDHLHQTKLALQYYQAALAAAANRRASFSAEQVRARVLELQP